MIGRRRFLEVLAALGVSQTLPSRATDRKVSFDSYPFKLGIASGYPTPDGFVLWTRLAPRPLEPGGGLVPAPVPMRWEVAADESMKSIIFSGETTAEPAWAHSVHVEVRGLEPERWYWYRFSAGDAQSPVGRTRTAPLAASAPARLRFAFASCQQYEQGYFGAYRHIVADEPDLVFFLGDYIYESSWGKELVRSHGAPEAYTLDERIGTSFAPVSRNARGASAFPVGEWCFQSQSFVLKAAGPGMQAALWQILRPFGKFGKSEDCERRLGLASGDVGDGMVGERKCYALPGR